MYNTDRILYFLPKFKVTCKPTDFERRYTHIRNQTKQRLINMSNITFAIFFFIRKQKKKKYSKLNDHLCNLSILMKMELRECSFQPEERKIQRQSILCMLLAHNSFGCIFGTLMTSENQSILSHFMLKHYYRYSLIDQG